MLGRKKFKMPRINSVIGEHNLIVGELHFSDGLHLDGQVQGDVVGQQGMNPTLVISKSGLVEGNVKVFDLILDGTIVGDVEVENKAHLMGSARVTGTVCYRMLEMAEGAEVNGKLLHIDAEEPRLIEHVTQESGNDQVAVSDPSASSAPRLP